VIEAYFTVPFVRGKGRARFVRGSGMTYTPTETTNAMAEIQAAFLATKAPKAPRGTPVSVTIQVERHLPGSRPKRVEREPDLVKPDADNVAKLVLDALNGVAWEDDTQVTALSVVKRDRTRRDGDATNVMIWWFEDGDTGLEGIGF
jgi:Holliday junction resolvase RusA-like endonuclease